MSRLLYCLTLYLLLPATLCKLIWRGLRQPAYWQYWGERYGLRFPVISQPCIWLHCVSVGETRAASGLIHALLAQYPQHQILLTHATPTGRETGQQLFPPQQYPRVQRCYLPYDTPGAVQRFLHHVQPACGVLLETELWPNLIAACQQGHIPLMMVNARLSEGSARGYARFANLSATSLQSLYGIAAQTQQDADRLSDLRRAPTPEIVVTGNIKFDIHIPADTRSRGLSLRQLIGQQQAVVLFASTREGEEQAILAAYRQQPIPAKLVIVPRHPQRFDAVADLMRREGISYCRRSEFSLGNVASTIAQAQVILGDSMGEMLTYYAASDLAFIGGSLLPLGGQNLIEACALGTPVIIGPHTFNFAQAADAAVACGAAMRVADAAQLMQQIHALLADASTLTAMGEAGQRFVRDNQGATQRTLALIDEALGNQLDGKNTT